MSLYDVLADLLEEVLCVISVSVELDGLGEVKTEDTHDGLCIYCVSAGNEVNIEIISHNDIYELLDIVDRLK